MTYGKRTLIVIAQLFNALLGGWPVSAEPAGL